MALTKRQRNLAFVGGGIAALILGILLLGLHPPIGAVKTMTVKGEQARARVTLKRQPFTPLAAVAPKTGIKLKVTIKNTGDVPFEGHQGIRLMGPDGVCLAVKPPRPKLDPLDSGPWTLKQFDKKKKGGKGDILYLVSPTLKLKPGESYSSTGIVKAGAVDFGSQANYNYVAFIEGVGPIACAFERITVKNPAPIIALKVLGSVMMVAGALAIGKGSLGLAGVI